MNSSGYKEFLKAYAAQIADGWRFYCNDISNEEFFKKKVEVLQLNGLEILVGDTAFKPDGEVMPRGRVILVRGKA